MFKLAAVCINTLTILYCCGRSLKFTYDHRHVLTGITTTSSVIFFNFFLVFYIMEVMTENLREVPSSKNSQPPHRDQPRSEHLSQNRVLKVY